MRLDRLQRCVLSWVACGVVVWVLAWPRPARADIHVDLTPYIIIAAVMVVEVFVPDTAVEIDGATGEASADLSWPLAVTLGRLRLPDGWLTLVIHGLAEIHYNTECGARRGVFGGRLMVLPLDGPFGLYGEGGALIGEDGDSAVAGGGLVYELLPDVVSILGGYRASMMDDGDGVARHTITLNLELSAPLNWLYQDGGL